MTMIEKYIVSESKEQHTHKRSGEGVEGRNHPVEDKPRSHPAEVANNHPDEFQARIAEVEVRNPAEVDTLAVADCALRSTDYSTVKAEGTSLSSASDRTACTRTLTCGY
jgi:hypothetical protein